MATQKHRKGYFKKSIHKYTLTAYISLRKSQERVTNKELAKELGLKERTFYTYKKTGKVPKKSSIKLMNEFNKTFVTVGGKLNKQGQIFYKAVEKIRKDESRKKGVKQLTAKEMTKLKTQKQKITFVDELGNIFEAFYERRQETHEEDLR